MRIGKSLMEKYETREDTLANLSIAEIAGERPLKELDTLALLRMAESWVVRDPQCPETFILTETGFRIRAGLETLYPAMGAFGRRSVTYYEIVAYLLGTERKQELNCSPAAPASETR